MRNYDSNAIYSLVGIHWCVMKYLPLNIIPIALVWKMTAAIHFKNHKANDAENVPAGILDLDNPRNAVSLRCEMLRVFYDFLSIRR